MSESQTTAGQLNRTHIGAAITIIDPAEGLVTGELRQVFHQPNRTILYLNRPQSEIPEGTYFDLTLTADRSGIGEPVGLVEHTPAVESPVTVVPIKGRSTSQLWPGKHDTADRSTLSATVVEVFHDGNESELTEISTREGARS